MVEFLSNVFGVLLVVGFLMVCTVSSSKIGKFKPWLDDLSDKETAIIKTACGLMGISILFFAIKIFVLKL